MLSDGTRAQGWYLANLLVLPGLAFIALALMFIKQQRLPESQQNDADSAHIFVAFWMSLLAGFFIVVGGTTAYLFLGTSNTFWLFLILYFTIFHSSFVLLGMFNLSRAMSKRPPFLLK